MADGYVGLAPDGSGKKADTSELLNNEAVTVERQRVNIADQSDPNGIAPVLNDPPPNPDETYGLLVRQISEDNAYTQELLGQIANLLAVLSTTTSGVVPSMRATANISAVGNSTIAAQTTAWTFNSGALPVALAMGTPPASPPAYLYGGISV